MVPFGYHGTMRLMLLTARPDLQTNQRLEEAAAELGHELLVLEGTSVLGFVAGGATSAIAGSILDVVPDCVIARVGNWRPESVLAALEAVIDSGAVTPNSPDAIRVGRDHWLTVRALAAAGIKVPPTLAGADPEALADAAARHFGFPVVVKQRRSRMGVGVIYCAGRDHLEAVLDSLWRVGDEIIVQRWISGGKTSARLLVVGSDVVAAARFHSQPGEWRSNAARGGTAEKYQPNSNEKKLALDAADVLHLGQCGVDLLQDDDGPVVVEVNPTPGFLRLEEATGVDVAKALLSHAVASV